MGDRPKVEVMKEEGISFVTGADVGKNHKAKDILKDFDRVILACGASNPATFRCREETGGIYFAVDFSKSTTKSLLNSNMRISRTCRRRKACDCHRRRGYGNDCVGTAIRHGCASVLQLEMMPKLP